MALKLHKVGTNGRIQLGADLARQDDFYTAEKEDDGVIVLTPVEVVTTGATKQASTTEPDTLI